MPDYNSLYPFMLLDFFIGLGNLLHSDEQLLPRKLTIGGFCFSNDLRVRYASIGNSGGGDWSGDYRWLALDKNGESFNFTMFSVTETETIVDDPVFGTRDSYIAFIVGRGNPRQQHAALQLDLTDLLGYIDGESIGIFHDGRLTAGATGAAKKRDVVAYIKTNAPYLLNEDGLIDLGSIRLREHYSINDSDIYNMLLRSAVYCYYRDCFREIKKSQHRLLHP